MPAHDEEAFSARLVLLGGEYVCQREVADVDEEIVHGWWTGGFGGAGHEVASALVGSVQGGEGVEVMDNWAED